MIPTTSRHVFVVRQTADGAGFELERDYDVTGAVAIGDKIISALPDWSGRLWFVSQQGVVGIVDRASGAVTALPLRERIENSIAVDETGGVYVVTEKAMYRLDAGSSGYPVTTWREDLRELGDRQAGPGRGGLGHDADAARHATSSRSPTTPTR